MLHNREENEGEKNKGKTHSSHLTPLYGTSAICSSTERISTIYFDGFATSNLMDDLYRFLVFSSKLNLAL